MPALFVKYQISFQMCCVCSLFVDKFTNIIIAYYYFYLKQIISNCQQNFKNLESNKKKKINLPLIFLYFLYHLPNSWHLVADTLA